MSESVIAQLTDLDMQMLEFVCRLRVVTQKQLERLHAEVPDRTLRYRARRLHRLGLIGRTRPYRDRGSAPHHLWPTNRADALVRAEPPPRRGEREAPSPLFLAHAAAVSELYVVLRTEAIDVGLTLVDFRREGEARETFKDTVGHPRAIAPDARIALRDASGRLFVANVELDLGTMSHRRLRTKLEGYLAHAERHGVGVGMPNVPPLFFLTLGVSRAESFLRTAETVRARPRWRQAQGLSIAATARARRLAGVLTDRCWHLRVGDEAVTLTRAMSGLR